MVSWSEWRTTSAYEAFRTSSTFHEIGAALQPSLLTPPTFKRFILTRYSAMRENALLSLFIGPSFTAIYTWASPPCSVTLAPDSNGGSSQPPTSAWEEQWQAFATKAMGGEKCIHNSSASGWEVGDEENSEEHGTSEGFCGLLRWADVESHQAYIDGMRHAFKKGEGPSEPKLTLITLDMELCYVEFRSFKIGWSGSVAKKQPEVNFPNGLFKQM